MYNEARVTLIGGGPGDPELITVKGVKALADADVVLYDALISKELLNYANNAIKIYVGKRKGCHQYTQDRINNLLVEKAIKYGHVVRLKGGDSFIFGRGSEEMDYVNSFGIPCSVIPGISSSMAVPAHAGIPLTKRGVAESFWVLTGCTSEKQISRDIELAARSKATVIILMGMHNLNNIIRIFQKNDLGAKPVAIVQNGTTDDEKIGIGTVDSILGIVCLKKLSSPAIIVIGDVVKQRTKLKETYTIFSQNNLCPV